MRLSTPSLMTVLISFLVAAAAILSHLGIVNVPVLGSAPFAALGLAYALLLAGVFVRGL